MYFFYEEIKIWSEVLYGFIKQVVLTFQKLPLCFFSVIVCGFSESCLLFFLGAGHGFAISCITDG